ncbi:hypothetical protein F2P81_017262 [Scophthalmus maximus]|uniref:guanylate cyclase n=1 Tax=Scophthalmus maximus TaxID=52904 RepID=A0A6A4SH88_SCOMX|nr:hypothetical protein F2P81_017262 [Scophthalmus maximus]
MDANVDSNVKTVRRSKEEKKVLRKQLKASHTLLKHEGISTAPQPTKCLVVANGGLGNGVTREELCAALKEMGELETLMMPPHKPYAFVTYRSDESARKALVHLNGQKLHCGENGVTLYLSYVNSVTCEEEKSAPLPEGLVLAEDFVSLEEEALLLAAIDWSSTNDDVTAQKALKHRRVKHYGFEFRYDNNNVDKDKPLTAGLPEECLPVLERCVRDGHINIMPDQLTVNQYESGQGIPPHVDTHSAFEDTIISLSLGAKVGGRSNRLVILSSTRWSRESLGTDQWAGNLPCLTTHQSACTANIVKVQKEKQIFRHNGFCHSLVLYCYFQTVMEFRHPDGRLVPVVLPGRSLLVMKGESRYLWTHGITPRKFDMVPAHDPLSPSYTTSDGGTDRNLTLSKRGTRTSFTFRKIRHEPCRCAFLSACDSKGAISGPSSPPPSPPSLPCCRADATRLEAEYVHQVYDAIASHFSSTRHSPWPRVCHFLSLLPPGSVLADVGCGNGKYLGVNPEVIAERRLAAVRELVRLLKPGSQALIYVWAFEQEYNKQRSKYLKEHPENLNTIDNTSEDGQEPHAESRRQLEENDRPVDSLQDVSKVADGKLSVHTNRTAFNTQDLLVPWHLKEGEKKNHKKKESEKPPADSCSSSSLSFKTRLDCDHTSSPGCDSNMSSGSGLDTSDSKPGPSDDTTQTSSSPQKSEFESGPAPVFHRYYHVFQQGELEQLCVQVAGVKVQSRYHDQGNCKAETFYASVMAAFGASFESTSSIEERKEKKRQARQEVVEQAKQKYEREEKKKELKRLRGEDTWMLPEVNQRLQQLQEEGSVKSKKKKKEKKSKKKKEEKKKKAKKEKKTVEAADGSSNSSEASGDEWVEAQPQTQAAKPWKVSDESKPSESSLSPAQNVQRDEWMTFDFLAMSTTSTAEKRAEKERQKEEERAKTQAIEQAGLHKLELNPYWKNGGSGLPPGEMAATAAKKAGPVVNDGGLSWLRKSYQRMEEQAERQQRSITEVVAERYGSMEEFQQRLAEAEKAVYGHVRGGGGGGEGERGRSESESEDEEEEEEEVPLLSEEEMNRLASELVKAEIRGKTDLVEKLKSQLDAARTARDGHAARKHLLETSKSNQVRGHSTEDQEVLLFRTDQSGRAWPVKAPSGPQEPHGGRRKKKPIETHVDGQRVRYFQNDDGVGLQEMVRREKMSSAQDQNALYSRMAAKMMGKTDGDNYTLDDMFVSSAAQREGEGMEEERMRSRAIGESRRLAASLEKCHHCFSSQDLQKHLIVAIGSKAYLSLPAGVSMTEGHCLICPLQHHCSATGLDEDVWSEMQIPRGLPFFAVDFGLQGGFAHVIENEQKFPHYFGKPSTARSSTTERDEKKAPSGFERGGWTDDERTVRRQADRRTTVAEDERTEGTEERRRGFGGLSPARVGAETSGGAAFCGCPPPKNPQRARGIINMCRNYRCGPTTFVVWISSESFSSSVGSDCGLESPGGDAADGALEAAEESRGCPFASFPSAHRAVLWNGRSLADRSACPAGEQQQQPGPGGPHKRAPRRRRVNLDSLGESLRRLTSPTTQTVQEALQRTLQFYRQQEIRCQEVGSEDRRREKREEKCPFLENSGSEEDILQILQYMATILGVPFSELREHFGEEFFGLCFEENERVLRAVGGNLQDFFNGFDAILEHIRTSTGRRASSESPSFQCKDPHEEEKGRRKLDKVGEQGERDGRGKVLLLHCFNPAPVVGLVMPGFIRAVARRIFHSQVEVEEVPPLTPLLPNEDTQHTDGDSATPTPTASPTASPTSSPSPPSPFPTSVPTVCLSFQIQETCPPALSSLPNAASASSKRPPLSLSTNPSDLRIGLATFCRAFPFHLVLGPRMELLQLGEGLRRQTRIEPHRSLSFRDCFEIVSPKMEPSFRGILLRLASPFTIRTRPETTQAGTKEKVMELKGQMIHVPESCSLMFLGSPRVDKLEELMGRGLYLSDIPIHDATRDVILVGEQAKAQDGLKKRMDKLKATLERTHQALEEEKRRTVDLLYSIFPGDVAQKLWQGQPVPARKFDDVTMLFSDIVGFTAVCAQCTPMQVISMLNELYTRFDYQCGILDVYKIETIGDAYCVAGGLHKKVDSHAKPIAHMALKMMELSEEVLTPDGRPIKLRIGIHTGSVLAGVVGVKMPRYCLFGNNVTLASKFESGSHPRCINVSPTTYLLLKDDRSFSFVPRSRLELPDNFPKEIPGTCYFLEAGTSHSHASLTSSRSAPPASMRKVSYSIGTMFLRETSL